MEEDEDTAYDNYEDDLDLDQYDSDEYYDNN
jgi:hypothetical protein